MYPSTTQAPAGGVRGFLLSLMPFKPLQEKKAKPADTTDGQSPNPRPSDVATQHLAGDKSATLGAVESTPSSSNNTPAAQNEDIYMGDGNGG